MSRWASRGEGVCFCQALGRLFPQDRDGELDLVQLRHTVQHVDALARGGVYHRADPQSEPSPGLLARVEQAVGAVPGG